MHPHPVTSDHVVSDTLAPSICSSFDKSVLRYGDRGPRGRRVIHCVQMCANVCKCVQECANVCKSVQKGAKVCESVRKKCAKGEKRLEKGGKKVDMKKR